MKKSLSTAVAAAFLITAFVLVSFTSTTKEVDEKVNTTMVEATITTYSDYKVVRDTRGAYGLGLIVRSEMSQGWQPLGGASQAGEYYIQAMVK